MAAINRKGINFELSNRDKRKEKSDNATTLANQFQKKDEHGPGT